MNIDMFIKASKNIGLISKPVKRSLEQIDSLALPSVIYRDNQACVLVEINKEKNEAILVIDKDFTQIKLSLEELKESYDENIIIIKPTYQFKNKLKEEIKVHNNKKWFWSTMKKNIPIYKLVIIASIFVNLFVIAMPLYIMNVYDRVLPNNALDTLYVLVFGVGIVLIFDLILKLLRAYFIEQAAKRADIRISGKIFDQLLNLKLDSKPSSTGMFVSRFQSFESVREFFTTATITAIVDLPFIILFLLVIYYIGGSLVLVSITSIALALLVSFIMQKPIKKSVLKAINEDQIKQTTLNESVAGLEIIKGVKAQNRMKTHWERAISQTTYFNNKTHFLSQIVLYIVTFIAMFSGVAIVAYGTVLASEGVITMGVIIAAMLLNNRVVGPISQIVSMIIKFDRIMISLKNIDEIMNMPVERTHTQNYLSRPNLKGEIIFKDLIFSYKDQKYDTLKNINLKIKENEKVAILGKIGSGKSTLAKLLLNFYEPSKGSILIDGTDLRQIDPIDLRKTIGYVPQEPFLFMGTIKDNITIGEHTFTDEQILNAAKIAGVDEFISKHESGYDLMVGERGEGLSGGERQSITLARAILSNPNILILDEPTNMMDDLSENYFKEKVETIIQDKTLVLITHKPSLLSLVDRIIVIDDGKVIADGPKEKILITN